MSPGTMEVQGFTNQVSFLFPAVLSLEIVANLFLLGKLLACGERLGLATKVMFLRRRFESRLHLKSRLEKDVLLMAEKNSKDSQLGQKTPRCTHM